MPGHQSSPAYLIERLRAQSRSAKVRARQWDGTIGLDWHRIAKIHDKLADSLERCWKLPIDAA